MCGIVGGVWPLNTKNIDSMFAESLATMNRRGPDDQGYESHVAGDKVVALGHTRLAIIDLSENGHQPMSSACGRYHMVFNGEIYNYKELAQELLELGVATRTETDTEVLLLAWMSWGAACLTRLVGMFAFSVFDKQEGTLTLARDAFGIKPLFYMHEGAQFVFGSTLQAVSVFNSAPLKINYQQSYEYLVHGRYDQSQFSFVDGVNQVLPSNLIVFDIEKSCVVAQEKWWNPSVSINKNIPFPQAAADVRRIFLKNIKLHLRSDVPVGVALSGGVDSSAIACSMRYVYPDMEINSFSYIAEGSDASEECWVDLVNDHIQAKPHKVTLDQTQLFNDLDELIDAQGEPFGSTSIYAGLGVFKEAKKQGVKVLIEGQGADEMLAGYHGYPGQRLKSLLLTGRIIKFIAFFIAWGKWPGRSRKVALQLLISQLSNGPLYYLFRKISGRSPVPNWIDKQKLQDLNLDTKFPLVPPQPHPVGRSVMAELRTSLLKRGLPALLRHSDRNSMHCSIESRVPFLTIELAEYLLALPEDYLISCNGETKHVFREAMRGIVPDEILDRKDKIGFETPESRWVKENADNIRSALENDSCALIEKKERLIAFDSVIKGTTPYSWQVWRWINFSYWEARMKNKKPNFKK